MTEGAARQICMSDAGKIFLEILFVLVAPISAEIHYPSASAHPTALFSCGFSASQACVVAVVCRHMCVFMTFFACMC